MPNPAVLGAAAAGVVLEPLAGLTLADRSPPADATPVIPNLDSCGSY